MMLPAEVLERDIRMAGAGLAFELVRGFPPEALLADWALLERIVRPR